MSVKYGIKVPIDSFDVWVLEDSGKPFPNDKQVQLFESREAAEQAAQIWTTYTVKEYFDNDNFDWDNLANQQKA
jgi:hypothetical protein